jgi:N-acetylneuraminic acid mutarotase
MSAKELLTIDKSNKVGPFRLLRFANTATADNELLVISRRERTMQLKLPRVQTARLSLQRTTEWSEKSLKSFELPHSLSNKSSDELVKTFKTSIKEQYSVVNPAIDKNLQRLSLSRNRVNSRPVTSSVKDPGPPKQSLMEDDAVLIYWYYPNPSYSKAGNRIVLPGGYDYDSRRQQELAKSQYNLVLMRHISDAKQQSGQGEEEEEEEDEEEFILNLMRKSEARALNRQKEALLSGLSFFLSQRDVSSTKPESREGATLVCINRRFYLFAGQGKDKRNDVRVLNPDTWAWVQLNTAYTPKGRIGHTACAFKSKMVVFGGWAHYSQRMGIRRCFRKVYTLRLKQGVWYSRIGAGEVPKARRCHMASVLGYSMVIFGGLDSFSKRLRSTYVYDLKEQMWSKVPTSCIPGGRSNASFTPVFHSSLHSRSDFSVMSPPRLKAEFVLPGSGFYLFGGLNADDVPTNDMYVLTMENGSLSWSEIRYSGPAPIARYDHCAAYVQGNIIICGGRNDTLFKKTGNSCMNDVHVFKVETLSWQEVNVYGSVPEGRWGHCCAVYGTKMLMLGGINLRCYQPSNIFVLETDQSYVSELVRQKAEEDRRLDSTALKKAASLFSGRLFK